MLKGVDLTETFSRTPAPRASCKSGTPALELYDAAIRRAVPSDASAPGANRGVAASVRVQDRQRVGGTRFGTDGDEHATPADQRFLDATVVRLEADAAHRRGDAEFREIASAALQRIQQTTASDERAYAPDVEAVAGRAASPFDQRSRRRLILRHDRQRFGRKARPLQRIETLLSP